MKKKVLTSLELYSAVRELEFLKGARVDKIYQLSSKELMIYFYKTSVGKRALKIDSGHGIYITQYDLKKPPYPSSFCMFLRKYLNRAEVSKIIQKNLERIVEIHFKAKESKFILILELFSKGNFVLTDSEYKIVNVANVQKWKSRTVKKGEIYKYPPSASVDLFNLKYNEFKRLFDSDKEVVRFLASDLGIGGIYAEEVCIMSKVDKTLPVNKLDAETSKRIFNKLKDIVGNFENMELKPGIVKQNSKIIDAIPFKVSNYPAYERTNTWNDAIDLYFTSITASKIVEKKEEKFNEELEKLNTVLEKQEESLEKYKSKSERYSQIANKMYQKYDTISEILNKIKQAKKIGYSTDQLKKIIAEEKESGVYEAEIIKEINEDSIVLDLGEDVEFLFDESIEKTAEFFYEKSKEYKSKIPGAERVINETRNKIEELKNKEEDIQKDIDDSMPKEKKVRKEKWFEKFHWFYTSKGNLAIGGRDATQNDILLKKYLEPRDLVFHTEMAGSPFFILKNGQDAQEKELNEVAIATVSYSRAWKEGISSTDAYCIRPEQVSKQAPSGEYVSKGAWMIRGKKNEFKNVKLEFSIGKTKEFEVISGPVSAVAIKSVNYVVIKPGWSKKSVIGKKIIDKLDLSKNKLDLIIKYLPAGDSTIISTV